MNVLLHALINSLTALLESINKLSLTQLLLPLLEVCQVKEVANCIACSRTHGSVPI